MPVHGYRPEFNLTGGSMKSLGDIAAGLQGRIKPSRKRPKVKLLQGRQAALQQLREAHPEYAVIPWRVFLHDGVIGDKSCLAVFVAIALHAKKGSGITECGQERIAALCGLSTRTVTRKVAKLRDAGLLRIEYRRPINGSPLKRMNVMRIIYDDGTLTRQDVKAIAQPNTGQSSGVYVKPPELSTDGQAHTGQIDGAYAHIHDTPPNHIHDKALSPTIRATALSSEQLNILKNTDILDAINRALVRFRQKPLEFTESDLATINGTAITERDITGAVADYLLDCQDQGTQPQPTLPAILGNLLQVH
jgi:hypothetical protein